MALNYNQFAASQPGNKSNSGASNFLASIASGLPGSVEKIKLSMEDDIESNLKTLTDMYNSGGGYGGNFIDSIAGFESQMDRSKMKNSFEAWRLFKSGLSKRDQMSLKSAGIDSIKYAELYDRERGGLINGIHERIIGEIGMKKLGENDVRARFDNSPGVAAFLNENTDNPELKALYQPKRNFRDQWKDLKILPDFQNDTFGEIATAPAVSMPLSYGVYKYAKNKFKGKAAQSAAKATQAASGTGGIGGTGPGGGTSLMQKAKNLFSSAKGKSPSVKSISNLVTKNLGKTRGLAMLARFGPYGALAALIGGAGYALYKNRDTYQDSQDARIGATYGGGPVDTSGAAGIEAARQKMAAYNAKYGR